MQYSISLLESQHQALLAHLFSAGTDERAAFLLGRQALTPGSTRILIKNVLPVSPSDVISASPVGMRISSRAYLRALKTADQTGQCFIFVHSHPSGPDSFSHQDDLEESVLFQTAYNRIHHEHLVHGSLVFSNPNRVRGRIWLRDRTHQEVSVIKVIGNRFRYIYSSTLKEEQQDFFDRQARAFTSALQPVLKRLHVGVIGAGGTGSSVCEQLVRLGIGKLTIVDPGKFENSNVSRVYGSTAFDRGIAKVNLIARHAAFIGLETEVHRVEGHLSFRSVTQQLIDCDMIFGCTDDEWGRSILNRLALQYYVPVFDMGVSIDTDGTFIRSIQGRVTTLMPGTACLFCRKRITAERIRAESLAACDPEQAEKLRKEGYIANVDETAPSVITFTTGIASLATSEFLHRLTGFQGPDRATTETIVFFDQSRMRTNSTPPSPACSCADERNWGNGDMKRFLGLNWRGE